MKKTYIEKHISGIENNDYYIKSVEYCSEGLIITLTCNEQKDILKIKFNGFIESYRYGSENYRTKILEKLEKNSSHNISNKFHYFYLEKSKYLTWLDDESYTITSANKSKHYMFIDKNSVLDVITWYDPEIEIIKTN